MASWFVRHSLLPAPLIRGNRRRNPPDWVAYYKHLLSFEQVGVPALYPPGGIPITLLAGHIDQASKRAQMRNRFFRVNDEDVGRMRRMLASIIEPQ